MLPSISVKVLTSVKENLVAPGEASFISVANQSDVSIVDLWHTKCTRCPAVLGKFNDFADKTGKTYPTVGFYSCALSQGPADRDLVEDLVNDWENISHIFIEESDKNALKTVLGYTAVPFYFVFDKEGRILFSGEPKQVNLEEQIPVWLQQVATANENQSNNTVVDSQTKASETTVKQQQQQQIAFDEDF